MVKKAIILLVILFVQLLAPINNGHAQSPAPPTYIVQSGDTLNIIAIRFGVSVNDILTVNNISDANLISIGTQLVIPGIDGISGLLTTQTIDLGTTLDSLPLTHQISRADLIRLNKITSPAEIFIGANLILPRPEEGFTQTSISTINNSESYFTEAINNNLIPWEISLAGDFQNPWLMIPGDLFASSVNKNASPTSNNTISSFITDISIKTLPLIQGSTASIIIKTTKPMDFTGSLINKELHIFQSGEGEYAALQGVPRMLKPGLYTIQILGTTEDGKTFNFEQSLLVAPRLAIYDNTLMVDPETIDPNNTKPEDDLVFQITGSATPKKYWTDIFRNPIDVPDGYSLFPDCTTSRFGNLRSYNNGAYNYYHTGIDLSACGNNLNIYSPAPGIVVYTGPLTVRGNYVVVDHGWGVYSANGHLSEINVQVGQPVNAGDLLGLIGQTGRVAGPHLHFEIWVNGVLVEPLDWLNNSYP